MTNPMLDPYDDDRREGVAHKLLRVYREFGYPDLTIDEVRSALDGVLDGKPGKDVISVMIQTDLQTLESFDAWPAPARDRRGH